MNLVEQCLWAVQNGDRFGCLKLTNEQRKWKSIGSRAAWFFEWAKGGVTNTPHNNHLTLGLFHQREVWVF